MLMTTRARHWLKLGGEILIGLACTFVALAPRVEEWGLLAPFLRALH